MNLNNKIYINHKKKKKMIKQMKNKNKQIKQKAVKE